MKYNEIRSLQNKRFLYTPLIDYYAYIFSPILTKIFIKFNIIPNTVTILMIISGVVGAVLFAFPQTFIKILGIFFIHLWYILDASDGEVARITKKFSKYGKELDYTAHVINHPLFIISFCLNILNEQGLILHLLILLCIDTMVRNFYAFEEIRNLKEPSKIQPSIDKSFSIIEYFLLAIDNFPMFALCFPIIYLVALKFGFNILYFYVIVKLTISFILIFRLMIRWIIYIHKS